MTPFTMAAAGVGLFVAGFAFGAALESWMVQRATRADRRLR